MRRSGTICTHKKRGRSAASGEAASASAVCRAAAGRSAAPGFMGLRAPSAAFDAEHAAQHKAHEPVCVKYDNLHAYGHSPFCRVRRRLPRLHVFAQPSGARAIRAALRRSAADDHDAERHHDDRSDKQCEPRGADARKDHAEAEGSGAHGALAAVRKAAVQAELRFTQNRHLRFPETRPEGLFQYIRKCRNVLHGTAPRAFRAYSMVLALTPSACRARRSRSRC